MKKAVMIIPADKFRDEEFFEPKAELEQNGISVTVASTTTDYAFGKLGAKLKPDILIDAVSADDFDAVVFIGGAGSPVYWDSPVAHKLLRQAFSAGKIVAGICSASVTLARSGILKGRRATVFSGDAGEIIKSGAEYTGRPVEI
ncbi:MAG: DJ-1/PfpI family protein, partial [Candidatus Omnitrophota bacterium]|nr:DJ-1/PfpI family protein [Candidatus Omnitrophota bacterium]